MKIKSVIIPAAQTALQDIDKVLATIAFVLRSGRQPIVVVGANGDEILRRLPDMEACDFVFDPSEKATLVSGIKAGSMAANGAAFVLPAPSSLADLDSAIWDALETRWGRILPTEPVHVIRPRSSEIKANQPTYPQLLTISGLRKVRETQLRDDWETTVDLNFTDLETL